MGLLCIAAPGEAWWLARPGADGGPSTHKPSGRLTSTKLSDHTATLFSAFLNWLCFKNTVETITNIVTSKPVMTFTLHKRRKLSSVADQSSGQKAQTRHIFGDSRTYNDI